MQDLPNTLYHYTSGDGLQGMFKNQSIWATHIQYMNDPREFRHCIELARNSIMHNLQICDLGTKVTKISELLMANLIDEISRISFYVTCFSEAGDVLRQWRGYSPSGFGYCLGFNPKELEISAAKNEFVLKPCIYDNIKQQTLLGNWAKETITKLSEGTSSEDIQAIFNDHQSEFIVNFCSMAPFFKHESFTDEKEWRIVSPLYMDSSKVELRRGKSFLVPYINVCLDFSSENSVIQNICVGPTPHMHLAMKALEHLPNSQNVPVHCSSIPYRDW